MAGIVEHLRFQVSIAVVCNSYLVVVSEPSQYSNCLIPEDKWRTDKSKHERLANKVRRSLEIGVQKLSLDLETVLVDFRHWYRIAKEHMEPAILGARSENHAMRAVARKVS